MAEKNEDYVRVGRVKDAHGIKGEIFITLFAGEAAWLEKFKDMHLVSEDGAAKKVFSVKSARIHKNGLIVKTNEIRNRNEAEELKGWFLEIPPDFLVSEKGESIYLREILGFRVFVKDRGEIGRIESFSSNNAQDLLVVKTGWGEFEIPFVEPFVEKMDFDARELHLDLPVGLLGESEE